MPERIDADNDYGVALEDIIKGAAAELPQSSRSRMRGSVLASVSTREVPALAGAAFMRAAALFATIAVGMGGMSYAAAASVPGDALYPMKRAMEETRVALVQGDSAKADALQEMTEERVREMHWLIERDASARAVDEAVQGFGSAAERAVQADPEGAQQRTSDIEDSAKAAPAPVRERVTEQLPEPQAPSGSGAPSGGSDAAPGPGPSGTDSGSGSSSQPAPTPQGDPAGPAEPPADSGGSGGSGSQGTGRP